jgi:hypothetical protein
MFCNASRVMFSISRHFPEKNPKRETQTISTAVPAADAAVGEAKPTPENGKVTPPRRVANRERRTREHLTPHEVDKLMSAAGRIGRHGHRDATLILIAFRHGLARCARYGESERSRIVEGGGRCRPPGNSTIRLVAGAGFEPVRNPALLHMEPLQIPADHCVIRNTRAQPPCERTPPPPGRPRQSMGRPP